MSAEQNVTVAQGTEPAPAWAVQLLVDVAVIKKSLEGVADHETRIRALEKARWMIAGLGTLGGAGLSQVVGILSAAVR